MANTYKSTKFEHLTPLIEKCKIYHKKKKVCEIPHLTDLRLSRLMCRCLWWGRKRFCRQSLKVKEMIISRLGLQIHPTLFGIYLFLQSGNNLLACGQGLGLVRVHCRLLGICWFPTSWPEHTMEVLVLSCWSTSHLERGTNIFCEKNKMLGLSLPMGN